MKKLILNYPLKNEKGLISYKDVVNNDSSLSKQFYIGHDKPLLKSILGDKYHIIANAVQWALQMDCFAEILIHEVLSTKHIGVCETRDEALDIAILLQNIIDNIDDDPGKNIPIITEVSDNIYNVLNHLINNITSKDCELIKYQWNEMVNKLNN